MDFFSQISRGLDSFFNSTEGLSKQQLDIIAVMVLIIGVLFCFFGYRFIKYLLFLSGFFSGAVLGLTLYYYIPWVNEMGELAQLSVAAVCGLLVGLLFNFIFHFALFIFGAIGAMWLALVFLPRTGQMGEYRLLLVLAIGLAGGGLGVFKPVKRVVYILISSVLGAVLIVYGLGHFNNWPVSITTFSFSQSFDGAFIDTIYNHNSGVIIFAIAILSAIAGVVVQWMTTRRRHYVQEPRPA